MLFGISLRVCGGIGGTGKVSDIDIKMKDYRPWSSHSIGFVYECCAIATSLEELWYS